MIKASHLLEGTIHPLIHGALMSRVIFSSSYKYFVTVSSYQESKKVSEESFDFNKYSSVYLEKIKEISNSKNWISLEEYKKNFSFCGFNFGGKEKAIFIVENDLNIAEDTLYSKLYSKLFNESEYLVSNDLNESKKHFIRGFCELRGSIDTTRPLLAMDYFYNSSFELGKARLLNEYFSLPYYLINLNFRQLQNQFIKNENMRNTQLRIQLNWYVSNIGLINDYKTKIVQNNYYTISSTKKDSINYIEMPIIESKESDLFLTRLKHFSTKIFNHELSPIEIRGLRNELGFDVEKEKIGIFIRNKDIVDLVRLFTKDECAGCGNHHPIENRTFIHRRTGRPYFEIHHNISLSNNMELDHEDNLVKLCPVCHTCLKSGVGTPENQKEIIENILSTNDNVEKFASGFFGIDVKERLVDLVFRSLK